jgi:glycosyltransferase involved in cell wall biosynthesis
VANLGRTDLIANLSFAGSRPTGIATYALSIVPQLFPDRQAVLASVPTGGESVRFPVAANLSHDHGLRGHFRRLLWTQFCLPQICSKLRSQLLFSPVPEAPVGSKCRFVVALHDTIPLRYPAPKSLMTHYFRYHVPRILCQAEHIVCNSEATASDVMAFFRIPAKKITPILLAYDATHFRRPKSESAGWGKRYFLYLGRHNPHKNLNRLISAVASLGKFADYRLLIAGAPDPRYTPLLQTQVEELGLGETVLFLDYIPYQQLPSLLSEAIALVFPSLWEGFGLPVLEAMACGTAVITSSVSSLPEVAGDAAILVDPSDVGAIASAMRSLLNDYNLRAQLGAAGLARAREFSWQRAGEETRAVLERFL